MGFWQRKKTGSVPVKDCTQGKNTVEKSKKQISGGLLKIQGQKN
jgi:hypothetical protein